MEQLINHSFESTQNRALMRLMQHRVRLKLNQSETETLKNMLSLWICSGIAAADDLESHALLQTCLDIVEKKLRPGMLRLSGKLSVKLDLMQAYCLMKVLEDMMFLPAASFELNLANSVMNAIDRQI